MTIYIKLIILVIIIPFLDGMVIRIGAMYPLYSSSGEVLEVGRQQQAAIVLALREINNKTDGIADDLLPNDELLLSASQLHNSFFSASTEALRLTEAAFGGAGVDAVLGPDRLNLVEGSFRGLYESKVPQLMYDVGTTIFSEPGLYPQFVRLSATEAIQGRVLAETIFDHFGWTKVTLIYTADSRKVNTMLHFKLVARDLGLRVLSEHSVPEKTTDMSPYLRAAKKAAAKIFVIAMDPPDAALLLSQSRQFDIFTRGDQIFGSVGFTNLSIIDSLRTLNTTNISSLMKGYMGITQRVSLESEEGAAFVSRWRAQPSTMLVDSSDDSVWCDDSLDDDGHALYAVGGGDNCTGLNFTSFAADGSDIEASAILAYDATYTLATALHALRERGARLTRRNVFDAITSVERVGVSGPIGYSTEFKWLQSDRNVGINYNVVNYRGSDDGEGSHEFVHVGDWSSESGFRLCDFASLHRPCYPIEFNTASGDAPLDGPRMRIRTMPYAYEATLFAAFIVGVVLVCAFAAVLYIYRKTRLVKISQPILQAIILVGCICGFVRIVIAIQPVTQLMCISVTWLSHMSFILIFGTLLAKTWRIHRVMNSGVKKVKITLSDILQMIGVMVGVVVIQLIILTTVGDPHVELVTVVDNQEKFVKERKCAFDESSENIISPVLYATEALLLLCGAWLAYASKNIPAGVGEFSKISNILFSIIAICVVGAVVVYVTQPEPLLRRFIILILFIIALFRCLYLLFVELTIRLLMGYDLDKNFNLTTGNKRHKSVFDTLTGKANKSIASENAIPTRSNSNDTTTNVTWTDELLDREIELCRANAQRYQKRLMELQEVAMARGVMRSSSNASNPSAHELPNVAKGEQNVTVALTMSRQLDSDVCASKSQPQLVLQSIDSGLMSVTRREAMSSEIPASIDVPSETIKYDAALAAGPPPSEEEKCDQQVINDVGGQLYVSDQHAL